MIKCSLSHLNIKISIVTIGTTNSKLSRANVSKIWAVGQNHLAWGFNKESESNTKMLVIMLVMFFIKYEDFLIKLFAFPFNNTALYVQKYMIQSNEYFTTFLQHLLNPLKNFLINSNIALKKVTGEA